MATRLLSAVLVVLTLSTGTVCVPTHVEAASQQQPDGPGYSAERVAKELRESPSPRLTFDRRASVAVFRATVEQHQAMLPFLEQFQKDLALTDFQQQSQEWYSKCCGIDILRLIDRLDKKLRKREGRKLREQIARELAQLEANRKK